MITAFACRVCGVAAACSVQRRDVRAFGALPTSTPGYGVGVCVDCATLDPERPGFAVRAALRVLGKAEDDDTLAADAFAEAGVDVLSVLYDRPDDPRRPPLRAPQPEPFAHVAPETRAALQAALRHGA